jgi:hypothetical protein
MDQIEPNALSYYSKITGISREEFIEIVGSQKHDSLKGVQLPIVENPNKGVTPKLFIEDLKKWIEQDET